MARHEVYLSIDIGSRSFKGAVVGTKGEEMELLAAAEVQSRGIDGGDIMDVTAFKNTMNFLLDELERQYPKMTKAIPVVSFSAKGFTLEDFQHRAEFEEEQLVTEELLEDLKRDAVNEISGPEMGKKVLNLYIKRYVLNGSKIVTNPLDMKASQLEMDLKAVRVDYPIGESIRATMEEILNFEPMLFASPFSAAEGALTETEKDSGVILADLGHDQTTVIAYFHGIPISLRYIPVGVKSVIKDIAKVFRTSMEEAEAMLKGHGSAIFDDESYEIEYREIDGRTVSKVPVEDFAMVVNARLTEIFTKLRRVYRELEAREFEGGIPGGIVLTGGGARIKGISELGTRVVKVNVRVGTFKMSFPIGSEKIIGDEAYTDNPAFSAVFGNIAYVMKHESEPVEVTAKNRKSFWEALKKFIKNLF